MKNRNVKELLLYLAVIFIMVMSLNLAVMDSTGMELPILRIVFLSLISVLSSAVIIIFPAVLLLTLAAAIFGSAYLYFKNPELAGFIISRTVEFFDWLYGYIVGYNYFEAEYSLIFAILYIVITTLTISLAVFSGRGSFVLIVLGTAAMTFFWFIYVERARLYLMLFLFAAVLLYSYHGYKRKLTEWKHAGNVIAEDVGRNWLLSSVLIITVSIILVLALPLNISPLRWSWLNSKVISAFPFVAEWRNDAADVFGYGYNSRYDLNMTGNKGRKLGGAVMQDPSTMLTVKAESWETFYLRGVVKEKYTGFGWNKANKKYKQYSSGAPMDTPYSGSVSTYERSLVISHAKLLTSTIFAPYSPYEVVHQSNKIYIDGNSEIYSSKMVATDETYTVKSLMPYFDIYRLRQSGADGLESNKKNICLQLPDNISDRVRSLAKEITKDLDNNFDKAKAIEKYLRSNYKYTLKPSDVPDKREFVDYFLFEGKEGYCTYYATSMAVLLRASGIPSRYVEGFISRYEGSDVRNVRGTDAHAWAEAYFDDYGWVTFEATPEYPAVEFKRSAGTEQDSVSEVRQSSSPENLNIPNISRRRGQLEDFGEGQEGAAVGGSKGQGSSYLKLALYFLLFVLIIRFVYMFIKWTVKEFRLEQYKGRRFAALFILDILWYLRKAGFVLEPEETLREFMERVRHNYNERLTNIAYIIDIMEKIRYGKDELSAEERKALEEFRRNVKKLACKKAGIIGFYTSVYITGR